MRNQNEAVSVDERAEEKPVEAAPEPSARVATLKADLHAALARGDALERALGRLVDHHSPVISDPHKAEVQHARHEWATYRDEVAQKVHPDSAIWSD